jgi:hypothetical protein
VVAPANAGFFALGLAMLQGILDQDEIPVDFNPKAIIYVAPVFRHTHFDGKQMVVHNRLPERHELFSYNLYPGPSAKKGIYGVLLAIGEQEQWVTAHCSTVQVITPYENKITFMHEGASGGGKSEMLEQVHREKDGSLLLGVNLESGERRTIVMPRNCELRPVTDDMALCHPSLNRRDGRLSVMDAENGWFVRVNHITRYGVDPHLEEMTIHPAEPLLFLNVEAQPGGTALIWEHIQDEPGKPCPNPRVIIPRTCGAGHPGRGGVGGHPQLRGAFAAVHEEPAVLRHHRAVPPAAAGAGVAVAAGGAARARQSQHRGLGGHESEGVGSYWPFATGRKVDQANLLLKQIMDTPKVRYILCPNQHVGVWKTGFMPQWIAREYLARRGGARFTQEQVLPARCPLLGYALKSITVEGQTVPANMLRVETQKEVGTEAYDLGAVMLTDFFYAQLEAFLHPDLHPLGRRIIENCMAGCAVPEYARLIPHPFIDKE